MNSAADDVLAAVRALAPEVAGRASETEQQRRVPLDLVDRMADAGVFRLAVPAELGGIEAHPAAQVEVLEELARADGSAGWIAMIGAVTGVFGAYLPEPAAKEIYGADPKVVTGGVFSPIGRATRDGDGWRATGRWPFASGSQHCQWLLGGCVAGDEVVGLLFPASEVDIVDTWNVSGLKGTGSHDMAVTDVWVPAERSLPLLTMAPVRGGSLYRFPFFGLLALGIGAVSMGIARRSIDEMVALSSTGGRRAAQRSAVQEAIAQAEASLGAARAGVLDQVGRAWAEAASAGEVPLDRRARLRIAITHAARTSAEITRAMYDVAGGAAIYDSSPLQRCFRDAHVATQHVMVGSPTYAMAGRVLLGLDDEGAQL